MVPKARTTIANWYLKVALTYIYIAYLAQRYNVADTEALIPFGSTYVDPPMKRFKARCMIMLKIVQMVLMKCIM